MGLLEISKEEKDAIRKQHQEATKKVNDRKEELKKGVQSQKKEPPKKVVTKKLKK